MTGLPPPRDGAPSGTPSLSSKASESSTQRRGGSSTGTRSEGGTFGRADGDTGGEEEEHHQEEGDEELNCQGGQDEPHGHCGQVRGQWMRRRVEPECCVQKSRNDRLIFFSQKFGVSYF